MNIHITTIEDKEFSKILGEKLRSFNNTSSPYHKESRQEGYIKYFNVRIRDNGFIAGMSCQIYWNSMFIDDLFIKEEKRKAGLGKILIDKAVEHSKSLNLSYIWLRTFSFQAKGFYQKQGFKVVGELKDYPPGESFYTMRLDLEKGNTND